MTTREQVSKSDIVTYIYDKTETITKQEIAMVIDEMLYAILKELQEGNVINLPPIGKFEPQHRAPRQARNPQTGEMFTTDEKNVPKFKPSKTLKDAVA